MLLLSFFIIAAQGGAYDCATTTGERGFCGPTVCNCNTDSATTNCQTTATVDGNFNLIETGLVSCKNGVTTVDTTGFYLIFPGEDITHTVLADTSYCAKRTRNDFSGTTTIAAHEGMFGDVADAAHLAVIAASATGKTCAITGGNPGVVDTANVVAHLGIGKTDGICVPKVLVNWRNYEAHTDATKICDRYYDAANGTGENVIASTYRILPGEQAVATTKLRCVAKQEQWKVGDVGSKECTATAGEEQYCNPGRHATDAATGAERCVDHDKRLGGTDKTLKGAVRATGEDDKWCIGETWYKKCSHEKTQSAVIEVCNPYTATKANICLPKADVLTKHGQTGTEHAARKTGETADPKTYCIPQKTGTEKDCTEKQVCNFAATKADGSDTCIDKIKLIGTIAATDSWTALGQVREKAALQTGSTTDNKYCFAWDKSDKYFFKACVSLAGKAPDLTAEICNPNALALTEVCVLEHKTLQHGETATKDKMIVIGDSAYKMACVFESGKEEVANWGAASAADACINKKEILNNTDPLKAFRIDAAKASTTGTPLMYCMSKIQAKGKNDAVQCKVDDDEKDDKDTSQVCNPHGEKGGADDTDAALCVTKSKVLAHGEVVTKKMVEDGKVLCIGTNGKATCVLDQACDLTAGTCFIAAGPDSIVLAPWTEAVEGGAANTCVGKKTTEKCPGPGYWCNPLGTTADGTVTVDTAKETGICLFENALHFKEGPICLKYAENSDKTLADVISAIKCGTDEPFCDDEGKCSATETVKEPVDPVGDPVGDYAATTSIWIGVAIAATLW